MCDTVIGKRIPKVDSGDKATGRAVYAGDITLSGMYYGKIVRCWEYAHARIKTLDFSDALKVPEVIKILGPDDVAKKCYNTTVVKLLVPEAVNDVFGEIADINIFNKTVKHQGDAICGIIAATEEAAERAAEKIKITYEPLPVYLTAEASIEEGKKKNGYLFTDLKPGNLACELPEAFFPGKSYGWNDKKGRTPDQLWDECDLIVEDTFTVPKQKQCQMENHAYVAFYDEGGCLNIWTSTRMPKPVQVLLAELFELPLSRVRLVQPTVGGGFGARLGMIGEPHVCALAMAVPGHPVRMEFLREEDFVASETRYPGIIRMKMGFKKNGVPVCVAAHFTARKGGYYTHGLGPLYCAAAFLHGLYKWSAMKMKADAYYTNEAPAGAFRGYGNPQIAFAQEQLIERMCTILGFDPIEWRKRWHKSTGDETWLQGCASSSDGLNDCLESAAKEMGWYEKQKRYKKQTGSKRRGIGLGITSQTNGAWPLMLEHTTCTAKLNEDCTVELTASISDLGTGGYTVITQLAAETLGFPVEDIRLKPEDIDKLGFDIGAYVSSTLYCVAPAVMEACRSLRKRLLERAGQLLGVETDLLEIDDTKTIVVKDIPGHKKIHLSRVAADCAGNSSYNFRAKNNQFPEQIQTTSNYYSQYSMAPFGATMTEVEVDIETGEVVVLKIVHAHDIGRAIHPPSVEGQLEGGLQQGLGFLLSEDYFYDDRGRVLNNNFNDYKMFGPSDMPEVKIILVETAPNPSGPLGAKNCGESALIGAICSCANAIYNAVGMQFTEAPITPEKIVKQYVKRRESGHFSRDY